MAMRTREESRNRHMVCLFANCRFSATIRMFPIMNRSPQSATVSDSLGSEDVAAGCQNVWRLRRIDRLQLPMNEEPASSNIWGQVISATFSTSQHGQESAASPTIGHFRRDLQQTMQFARVGNGVFPVDIEQIYRPPSLLFVHRTAFNGPCASAGNRH